MQLRLQVRETTDDQWYNLNQHTGSPHQELEFRKALEAMRIQWSLTVFRDALFRIVKT